MGIGGDSGTNDKSSNDQNFKNLLLDFTLAALRFFGGIEGEDIPDTAVITPLRQEQLKERLASGHHEIDASFLVDLPNGEREAIVYLVEEETEASQFSMHRLTHYMVEVAALHRTERIVPIVIFLRGGTPATELRLGTERATYLMARYIGCHLARIDALTHLHSTNIVARILLPCMAAPRERRVEVVMSALEGVVTLVADVHLQAKYTEFVSMYAGLDERQEIELQRVLEDAPWRPKMVGWLGQARADGKAEGMVEGKAEGMAEGDARGRAETLLDQLAERRLKPTPEQRARIESCRDAAQLKLWLRRVLSAATVGEILGDETRH
jgi:hypothetical protein